MTDKIAGFFGEHRFLSNFFPSPINYKGILYPTVEHAYQAAKTPLMPIKRAIANLPTPQAAKKAGKSIYQVDWHKYSLQTMHELVTLKFKTHQKLFNQLIATGNAVLEETNTWGDTFWGVCDGIGENHLGVILMKVRQEISRDSCE